MKLKDNFLILRDCLIIAALIIPMAVLYAVVLSYDKAKQKVWMPRSHR